jgi:hypothetical protein
LPALKERTGLPISATTHCVLSLLANLRVGTHLLARCLRILSKTQFFPMAGVSADVRAQVASERWHRK